MWVVREQNQRLVAIHGDIKAIKTQGSKFQIGSWGFCMWERYVDGHITTKETNIRGLTLKR